MVSHVMGIFHADHDLGSRFWAAELTAAREAFRADSGYAAAMASAAVELAAREHAAVLRARLAAGTRAAMSSCAAARGQFICVAEAACGTGGCRFASGILATLTVPAPSGRVTRPVNHVSRQAGEGFSTAAAMAALSEKVPYTVAVRVSAGDHARAADHPAR